MCTRSFSQQLKEENNGWCYNLLPDNSMCDNPDHIRHKVTEVLRCHLYDTSDKTLRKKQLSQGNNFYPVKSTD